MNTPRTNPAQPTRSLHLPLEETIDLYLSAINVTAETRRCYRVHLEGFCRFLQQRYPAGPPAGPITAADVEAYLHYRLCEKRPWDDNDYIQTQDRRLSPVSVHTTFRTLRAFFNWLERHNYLTPNPFAGHTIRPPTVPDKIPGYLRPAQVEAFLEDVGRSTLSARNTALFLLLLDTGARIREVLEARLADLDLEYGILKVVGKRGREREVPFTATTASSLHTYFATREDLAPTAPLFLNRDGRPLTYCAARMVLRRAFAHTQVSLDRCGPHAMRHSFARMYLQNGGDLVSLQQILGHRSLTTTAIYTRQVTRDLQERHRQASPVTALLANRQPEGKWNKVL